jgi:hypothetical protein
MKDDEILNAVLRNEEMESVAQYLSRGRRLQSLDEAALKQLWTDELWRALRERNGDRLREEICAELSLRRINRVELPSELQAAIEQAMGSSESLEGLADEIINAFERILAKPKN